MDSKSSTRLHFVGIGGIGMSGIAEVFLNQGYAISGSDQVESDTTKRLASLGAKICIGHAAPNVSGANVVVISSAVKSTNPEVIEARRLRIPVIPRAEMLGELMRGKTGIAVAGTHGKTTTTSMLATVLIQAGLDPTLVIGGKVDSLGGNAKLGKGTLVVAEADESDGSFLFLPATYGIITNIDSDHLDHFGSLENIERAFLDFVDKLPFYGLAVVCGEDAGVRKCLSLWTKPVSTYGFKPEWDLYADEIQSRGLGSSFQVWQRALVTEKHRSLGRFEIHVPGDHNVLNALACIAIAKKLGLTDGQIREGLAEFRGVKRRFEIRWRDEANRKIIVDDYGHHPTEIRATLAAARKFWDGRVIAVFQPHRYSRTQSCHADFLKAFAQTDVLLVLDIYAAGEEPIAGISGESLARDIGASSHATPEVLYVGDFARAKTEVEKRFKTGDLVLCLGAGSITRFPEQIIP